MLPHVFLENIFVPSVFFESIVANICLAGVSCFLSASVTGCPRHNQ